MPSAARHYTVDNVRAMPDDRRRFEVIAGELFVTPAPGVSHQTVLARLFVLLWTYVERHTIGRLWFAPVDVVFGATTLVEPDLVFVHRSNDSLVTAREITGAPDLVVEVISPTSARTDRGRKRLLYQESGVREYWVVDIQQRQVEIWRPSSTRAEIVTEALGWQPDPAVAELHIDLREVFRD